MKVLNLDKFCNKIKVIINNKEYILKGITVGQYIEQNFALQNSNPQEQLKVMIDILSKISNIDKETLYELTLEQCYSLVKAAQMIDVEQDSDDKKN